MPWSVMTRISSAFLMVESLWAMISVVRPFASVSMDFCMANSFSLSRAEVASSRIKIGGFFKKTLAMAMRCF